MKISDFVERIPESQGESRTMVGSVATAIAEFRKKANAVRADKDRTPAGHAKIIADLVREPRGFLRQLRETLAEDRAELRERREGLVLPKPNDSVTAEMRRAGPDSLDKGPRRRMAYFNHQIGAKRPITNHQGLIEQLWVRLHLMDHPAQSRAFHAKWRSTANCELLSFHCS